MRWSLPPMIEGDDLMARPEMQSVRSNQCQPFLFSRAEHRDMTAPTGKFDPALDVTVVEHSGRLVPLVLVAPWLMRTATVTKVLNEATDND
jgi:hypothetical protein